MKDTTDPYFEFGAQPHRFPYDWRGGAGGVVAGRAPTMGAALGIFDMAEAGYGASNVMPFPAFNQTILHRRQPTARQVRRDPRARRAAHPWAIGDVAPTSAIQCWEHIDMVYDMGGLGDWPLLRPAGPEPMDPNEGTRRAYAGLGAIDLSDPTTLITIAAVGGAAWWLWKRSSSARRRNPGRAKFDVRIGKGRGTYAMSFLTKGAAARYAAELRGRGFRARVARR